MTDAQLVLFCQVILAALGFEAADIVKDGDLTLDIAPDITRRFLREQLGVDTDAIALEFNGVVLEIYPVFEERLRLLSAAMTFFLMVAQRRRSAPTPLFNIARFMQNDSLGDAALQRIIPLRRIATIIASGALTAEMLQ